MRAASSSAPISSTERCRNAAFSARRLQTSSKSLLSSWRNSFRSLTSQDEMLDFVSAQEPNLAHYDAIITNPPYGERNSLIVPLIRAGLRRLRPGGLLCLLPESLLRRVPALHAQDRAHQAHCHHVARVIC